MNTTIHPLLAARDWHHAAHRLRSALTQLLDWLKISAVRAWSRSLGSGTPVRRPAERLVLLLGVALLVAILYVVVTTPMARWH